MEATGTDIGIVTGTVHARYLQLTITGEPSHVGPTTMDRRRDSLAAAAETILSVERIAHAAEPGGRLSPSAMLFIPSVGGITHNPREYSTKEQLAHGAQVLLDAVLDLAG
jgi:acetylornithine deacetylase/succinyl-diaminopimelate desuccinylase-like protein